MNSSESVMGSQSSTRWLLRRAVVLACTVMCCGAAIGASSAYAASPPVGKYFRCYQTRSDSGAPSGYSSVFVVSLVLKRSGPIRYQVGYSFFNRNTFSDHVSWSYSHGTLRFHRGFFGGFWHVVGRYAPSGVRMPHSQLTSAKYTIILRSNGAPTNDSAPPRTQGTDFRESTFFYCTTGKPTYRSNGSGSPTGSPAPPPNTPPAATPPPTTSGAHPPYGTYKCVDKYGYATDTVYLTDPFTYSEPNTVAGSFTYDSNSNRIDFQGGKFDANAYGWNLYGIYQSPNTIVLASKTQTTYGGPDADETGSHTFWHCTLQP